MKIPVDMAALRRGRGEDSGDWLVMELQGELELVHPKRLAPNGDKHSALAPPGALVGTLSPPDAQAKVSLVVGEHELSGRLERLPPRCAVLQRREVDADVRWKLVGRAGGVIRLSERPKPIIRRVARHPGRRRRIDYAKFK